MLEIKDFKYLGTTKKQFRADNIIISDVEYQQPVTDEWHCHQNVYISLILQGGCCESRKSKDIQTMAGGVVFYNKKEPHRNSKAIHPSKYINIEFREQFFLNNKLDFNNFNQPYIKGAVMSFNFQ